MTEKEQLQELNAQMTNCIKAVERIEIALVGDKFSDVGIIKRIDTIEHKLKKLDKYFWMMIGMFSLGTIPLGTKVLPLIKDYLK
jgi:uncharacterized membrane protein